MESKIPERIKYKGQIYERLNISEEENIEDDDYDVVMADDLVEFNLFGEGSYTSSPWYRLETKSLPKTRYIGKDGDIITSNFYDIVSQASFDYSGPYDIIYLSILEESDGKLAEAIANKLGLRYKFIDNPNKYQVKPGYKKVCAIHMPKGIHQVPAINYINKKGISPDYFRKPKRVIPKLNKLNKNKNS